MTGTTLGVHWITHTGAAYAKLLDLLHVIDVIHNEAIDAGRDEGQMTAATALPTTKRQKIIYLLDHWDDIHDPNSASPFGRPGTGSNTPHLSGMSRHPSVIELGKALAELKLENKLWHDHLKAYHGAEWRIHTRTATRKRKGNKSETITLRDRVRRPPAWVTLGYVRSGEFRLEQLFHGDVYIPQDLWDALTLSSDQIEAKARNRRRIAA